MFVTAFLVSDDDVELNRRFRIRRSCRFIGIVYRIR